MTAKRTKPNRGRLERSEPAARCRWWVMVSAMGRLHVSLDEAGRHHRRCPPAEDLHGQDGLGFGFLVGLLVGLVGFTVAVAVCVAVGVGVAAGACDSVPDG